jgi:hypothetical protein
MYHRSRESVKKAEYIEHREQKIQLRLTVVSQTKDIICSDWSRFGDLCVRTMQYSISVSVTLWSEQVDTVKAHGTSLLFQDPQ